MQPGRPQTGEGKPMTQLSEHDEPKKAVSASDVKDSRSRSRRKRRGFLTRVSIQSKLLLMLVLCTILAAAIVGGISYQTGRNSLREAAFNRLTEIRESQKRQLVSELTDLKNALVTYTNGSMTQSALQEFSTAFGQLSNATITPDMTKAIDTYYDYFAKETDKYSGVRLDTGALLPTSNAERYLQAYYTARLPTGDVAIAMDDEHDGSAWSAANAKYQGFFREIVMRFAFEDALLIDGGGNVVYSAFKNTDLGTNILNGPYNGSKLRGAYLEAMSSNKADRVAITDFEFYQPANMAPTAWMVAPIPSSGKPEGVLALQFPITKINKMMTFDRKWAEAGMGTTGETVLGGEDFLMRSDSRMFLEDPQKYRQKVIDAGTPPDIPDLAIRQGGTTLVQPLAENVAKEAQKGHTGTMITRDYLNEECLQAYAPIGQGVGLRWAIIAKISAREAFASETTFARIVVLTTTGIIFGVCLLAVILAQVFLRPIRRLEAGVQRISEGDYRVAIPVETRDEIGDLTEMFNEMSSSLSAKEEMLNLQRGQIKKLLNSLMPEAIADKLRRGEEVAAREHSNVTVIYATVLGLARVQARLDSAEALEITNEINRQFESAAAEYDIDRIRPVRNGYLGSCGLTVPRLDNVRRAVDFARECERIIERLSGDSGLNLSLCVGIDTGKVNSGLVGYPSTVFDLWGTAVNLAHRIKSGVPDAGVYVSSRVYNTLSETTPFVSAGTISADGTDEPIWRLSEQQ